MDADSLRHKWRYRVDDGADRYGLNPLSLKTSRVWKDNTLIIWLCFAIGVNKLEDFAASDAPIKPDFYVNSLGDLKLLAE